ncbi:LutC/YkgG family protein [Streptomyces reniochalinae]|uniref:Lactate utilization protein C n=1 Tax=Streptomyces reniochalinae TaxID=2250578 RepID=A0A367EU88_9ACTN|nr:LUD domain-containing protein [Streptomyces reniochalinae]RCG21686.1 lactate utilization protein C [Streptomyces reniochalinae]
MSSRETVLGRVRRALADVPRGERPDEAPVGRDYLRVHGERSPGETVRLLREHLTDYRARVHHCSPASLPETVAELLARQGSRSVVTPAGVPGAWLPQDLEHVADSPALTPHDLDAVGSVVTGCAVAVAETGTLVLDASRDQGRRSITLVPDHHVCVVRVPDQVVGSVPQALERLDPARPQTWISGPSATSDIELNRVEGVHGPRTLDVVLVGEESSMF